MITYVKLPILKLMFEFMIVEQQDWHYQKCLRAFLRPFHHAKSSKVIWCGEKWETGLSLSRYTTRETTFAVIICLIQILGKFIFNFSLILLNTYGSSTRPRLEYFIFYKRIQNCWHLRQRSLQQMLMAFSFKLLPQRKRYQ